jgi:tRNA modification GTPase
MPSYSSQDIIFALSSARGRSALSLHRISGGGCLERLTPHLHSMKPAKARTASPAPETMKLPHSASKHLLVLDLEDRVIDDCLVTFFNGPRSFTGEDTIEIATHGNPLICARLHSLLRNIGFREAKPGEFAQRAFLNGKIDLTRAEAIDQLIHSETEAGLDLARQASDGRISIIAHKLKDQLTGIMSYFEAHIDFADDEVGTYDSMSQLVELQKIEIELKKLANSFSIGLKIREGLKVSLLGTPNAGKSSLYNALLGVDRAIVTDIPGTTRDVVEDRFKINQCDFILMDTAGVRSTDDQVEKIGVARTIQSSSSADIVCVVIDPLTLNGNDLISSFQTQADSLTSQLKSDQHQKLLYVFTKKDRWPDGLVENIKKQSAELKSRGFDVCCTSANTNNISELTAILENLFNTLINGTVIQETAVLISQRQFDKSQLALRSLESAIELVSKNEFPEKVASMLIQTAQHISDIIGEIGTDDILEKIFSNFCIGK